MINLIITSNMKLDIPKRRCFPIVGNLVMHKHVVELSKIIVTKIVLYGIHIIMVVIVRVAKKLLVQYNMCSKTCKGVEV